MADLLIFGPVVDLVRIVGKRWRSGGGFLLSLGLLSYYQRQEESMLRKKAFMYLAAFIVCWIPSELCVLMCVYACSVCV